MSVVSDLTALTTLAQALSRRAELTESLDAALATVAEVLKLETGWVWLLDAETGEPTLAAARALPPALRDHPDAMHGDCYCLQTFRAGDLQGAANVNVVWCTRLAKLDDEGQRDRGTLRYHASVPLSVGDRRLGMLNVASRDWRVLSTDELNLLTTAGAMVSLVVERWRLEIAGTRARATEERNRLAREIHDTLAQELAALTMQLEVVDALAGATSDDALRDAAARALRLARSTLDEARRSVLDLRVSPLEGRTLSAALAKLAAEMRDTRSRSLDVRVLIDGGVHDADLPTAIAVGLYRIAQEALTNVARHAGATTATVRLSRRSRALTLRIEDDGAGFEPAAGPAGRFGLVGMRERARLLGGDLHIESSPGQGAVIDATVPLEPRQQRSAHPAT